MVSFTQGRVPAASALPPHRSTTVSSATRTLTEAPTSAPLAKLPSKGARRGANLSVVKPSAVMAGMSAPLAGCWFVAGWPAGGNLAGEIGRAFFEETGDALFHIGAGAELDAEGTVDLHDVERAG